MPILKQIQDLGGICWDRYITGSDLDALYINSKLDECAVKQINFNSNLPIETGIEGFFNNTKIFTDYKNNYFAQKTTTAQNQSNIKINTSSGFADLKLNNFNGIFKEINLYTDKNKSNINLFNSSTKDILIDTSDIPNNATAKFRCIKFDPNETEETCIKILSTKEILLKCCGSGEAGIDGDNGGIGLGGGNGEIGLDGSLSSAQGSIGLDGPTLEGQVGPAGTLDGIGGTLGLSGPISESIGSAGLDGTNGSLGLGGSTTVGQAGSSVNGDQGQAGSNASNGQLGQIGLGGTSVRGQEGTKGLDNTLSSRGSNGQIGGQGIIGIQGPNGIGGDGGIRGILGPNGIKGANGDGGTNGSIGQAGINVIGPQGAIGQTGPRGSDGGIGISPGGVRGATGGRGSDGSAGGNGSSGPFTYQDSPMDFGRLWVVPRRQTPPENQLIYINAVSGFINPYNKNDTTNNPVQGTINGVLQ
jgi:hypothetical protein